MRIKKFLLITLKSLCPNMSKVTKTRQRKYILYMENLRFLRKGKRISKKRKKVLDTEKVVWYYIKAVREAAVYLVN